MLNVFDYNTCTTCGVTLKQITLEETYFPVILFLTIEMLMGGRVFGNLTPADFFFCLRLLLLLL